MPSQKNIERMNSVREDTLLKTTVMARCLNILAYKKCQGILGGSWTTEDKVLGK